MPVLPENRARYPADWPAISRAVKDAAGWRCQGSPAYPDCRLPHGAIGYRDAGASGQWVQLASTGDAVDLARYQFRVGDCARVLRIVLTVGHLDHTPENCDPANLRAWCQRCHLTYDAAHHATTRAATRRHGKAAGDLFGPAT